MTVLDRLGCTVPFSMICSDQRGFMECVGTVAAGEVICRLPGARVWCGCVWHLGSLETEECVGCIVLGLMEFVCVCFLVLDMLLQMFGRL